MKQSGFARTGFARDQSVLAGPLSNRQVLQLCRAGAANRNPKLAGGVLAPNFSLRRRHMFERYFHSARIPAAAPDLLDEFEPSGSTVRTCGATRLESRLLRPTSWMNSVAFSGEGGGSSVR